MDPFSPSSESPSLGAPVRAAAVLVAGVLLALASTAGTAAADSIQTYGWPLWPRPPITRHFDRLAHDWLAGHRGVDLAGYPGQTVVAAGDGVVTYAGAVAGVTAVTVSHPGDLRTTYEPVHPTVRVGAFVRHGTSLGALESGHLGCPTAACLHWGLIRRNPMDEYLDPLGLLHVSPLRLKPTWTFDP